MQPSQNVESRVIKSGDGMEDADSRRMQRRVILAEYQEAKKRPSRLKAQGHHEYCLHQPYDSFVCIHVQRFLDQHPALNANPLACRQYQAYADRCDAQASDLDQDRHHRLPEYGKMIRNIRRDQSSHADSAGGSKERIDHRYFCSVFYGNWKQKQECSQQDYKRESRCNEPPRRLISKK